MIQIKAAAQQPLNEFALQVAKPPVRRLGSVSWMSRVL
jgi:hypothetical protein